MSGISAIYFLDRKGKPIIFRNYRGEVDQDVSEAFQKQVLELEEANMKPTFTIGNVHYCWTKHQNIYSNKYSLNTFHSRVSRQKKYKPRTNFCVFVQT